MNLEIITPELTLFSGEIQIARLPGVQGSFEILQNHAPLISILSNGKIKVKDIAGVVSWFDINGGVVEVNNNNVRVLVEA
jgi:F-type H+-transporting ATPase subunit epsilon